MATHISCAASCGSCRRSGTTCWPMSPRPPGASTTCCASREKPGSTLSCGLIRICSRVRTAAATSLEDLAGDADLVIVHEWNEPALVAALGRERRSGLRALLFHDTHHRAVSDPDAIRAFDLRATTACSPFGATLAQVYDDWGWGGRVFVWHEAADTRLFQPPASSGRSARRWSGSAIGATGSAPQELEQFLLKAARDAELPLAIYGVRYPARGAGPAGALRRDVPWLASQRRARRRSSRGTLATVHVPRRYLRRQAARHPDDPRLRSACLRHPARMLPLVGQRTSLHAGRGLPRCGGWRGDDRASAGSGDRRSLRDKLASHGRATIEARHTCAHRARELLDMLAALDAAPAKALA